MLLSTLCISFIPGSFLWILINQKAWFPVFAGNVSPTRNKLCRSNSNNAQRPPGLESFYMSCVMSVWEIALHKAVNNFGLTCVGVRECVGGFLAWVQYTTDREEQVQDWQPGRGGWGLVLKPACHIGVHCLCLSSPTPREAEGQYRRPFTRK